jgi:membrane protein
MSGVGEISDLLQRLWRRSSLHRIPDEAAKIAYFSFLSLFPLILILFALAGILGGETAFDWVMTQLLATMPPEAAAYLGRFVQEITGVQRPDVLSASVLFLLIAASSAVVSVISGLNLIFGVTESRPWWRRYPLAVTTTLLGALFLLVGVSWSLGGPALLARFGLGWIWSPLVFTALSLIVWLAYVFLPNYRRAPSRLALAVGAVVATSLWVLVTHGFRIYLASFERFVSLYGFVTGILVLLIWFYLTAFALLFGGEVAATLAFRERGTG